MSTKRREWLGPVAEIDVPYHRWEQTGPTENPKARLTASIEICGLFMHLEAWELRENKNGEQESVAWPEDFDGMFVLNGAGFRTVNIDDREYALIAFPGAR